MWIKEKYSDEVQKRLNELEEDICSSTGVPKECINTKYDSATAAIKARNEEFRNKISQTLHK